MDVEYNFSTMGVILAYIWKHRWWKLLIAILLVATFVMANDFTRQSIFGPKIDGAPLCAIEEAIRAEALPQGVPPRRTWFSRLLQKLGLMRDNQAASPDLGDKMALPVFIRLAEDPDVHVRRHCLWWLAHHFQAQSDETLPILERHLADEDAHSRVNAAAGVWRIRRDVEMRRIFLAALEIPNADLATRRQSVRHLGEMGRKAPDLFESLAVLTRDPDDQIRITAIRSMPHFGLRGMPAVRIGLRDPDGSVRQSAVSTSARFGKESNEFVPDLLAMGANDPDRRVRIMAPLALHEIDPERFPDPRAVVESGLANP